MARALSALERGKGADAVQHLAPILRSATLTRDDELAIRCALADAWLLQDDVDQASTAVGRPPDLLRERIEPARLSGLWRQHGRIAFARGDQSRAIALLTRALRHAEQAHDSRAIGLAHFELGLCYKQVGDLSIVREQISRATSALHAAGDRRYMALLHSLSGTSLAQAGRYDEAMAALRQAEHLATLIHADDVLGTVCGNQANVALMRHRHEQALALAERGVAIHEGSGSPHGLAVGLATLGQICVRIGSLQRAEQVLHRALEVRTPVQFHETTGAVFDSLAQISLIRGDYDAAERYLKQAGDAYGGYGQRASRWYEWSVRLLTARVALRRGLRRDALALADALIDTTGVPPADLIQAHLIAAEALAGDGDAIAAERRLALVSEHLDPRATPGAWGEYLRLRAQLHQRAGRVVDAYHDLGQSASVFDLLGERYQGAVSRLALCRLAAAVGARSMAERRLREAKAVFEGLGAAPDLEDAKRGTAIDDVTVSGPYLGTPTDADDAIVRRLVDAAVLPDLLLVETANALLEATSGEAAVVFVQAAGDDVRIASHVGCDLASAEALARAAVSGSRAATGEIALEALGHHPDGPRFGAVVSPTPIGYAVARRLRMIGAVARQGFDICAARDRTARPIELMAERPLEALIPGFVCSSDAMRRVVDQIRQLQGNDLTVLITGESGTGKELVARAIHLGSLRATAMFLPYNCTSASRELADSQLFGHRRGSFTGAITDQPGLIRSAEGGTLFLDEIGDLPLEVQPKLLRFLEHGEILPVGETRPQQVQVRVIAATNADLEQRVAEGKFREDLYYRLTVIRIHVPALRERREAIPHLCALFLREACERLGKPEVELSKETLDLFSQHWWPGNVRQLRNEIQRAVAMSAPGGLVGPEHLSPEFSALAEQPVPSPRAISRTAASLSQAVEQLEREMIQETLARSDGNISEAARSLGLTRRGLYLKMRRLGLDGRTPMDKK
jgi:DNA-binding NtrC family response regulator/tetratricopeptide (TPR) repeat protein